MLRGENIACGTSTTGTGTLTLASTPSSVGAIDPVIAFGTSGGYPVSYTVVEYADSTYAKPTQYESGVATLTLASSISSATLARAPLFTGVIGTPAYNGMASTPSAISIGTAANVLVFLGANAHNVMECLHFYATSGVTNNDGLGITGVIAGVTGSVTLSAAAGTTGTVYYTRVWLMSSGLIKSASFGVVTALTAGANSTCAQALYDINSSGLPGKQLISFGSPATGSLASVGLKTSTAGAAKFISAGFYFHALLPIGGTGATGTPAVQGAVSVGPSPLGTSLSGTGVMNNATVASQSALADPATTTSIAGLGSQAYDPIIVYRST